MVEIRRSYDRLISTMGFPIPVRRHLNIESRPCSLFEVQHQPAMLLCDAHICKIYIKIVISSYQILQDQMIN